MPDALAVKYPNANASWSWQWVFPASQRSIDPRSGIERWHHLGEQVIQRAGYDEIVMSPSARYRSRHGFRG